MFVARYVALVALAIWMGGMVTPFWINADLARVPPLSRQLAYTCGAAVVVSLFLLKFVGPPPRAFPFRTGLVVLMLTIVTYAHIMSVTSIMPTALNIAIGLILLSWYARE
ncbi:MAG: hypothetical protein ABJA98_35220 [Acidobacteriota bacterium]